MLEHSLCFINLQMHPAASKSALLLTQILALVSPNSTYIKKITSNSMQHRLYLSKSICMQSRSRMHLLPISTSFLNWTFKACLQVLESIPRRGWKQYSHVLNHIPQKIPEEMWTRLESGELKMYFMTY